MTIEPVPMSGSEDFVGAGFLDLPCVRGVYADGTPFLCTRYRLTRDAIDEISRTGHLYVTVLARQPQPIRLTATLPEEATR